MIHRSLSTYDLWQVYTLVSRLYSRKNGCIFPEQNGPISGFPFSITGGLGTLSHLMCVWYHVNLAYIIREGLFVFFRLIYCPAQVSTQAFNKVPRLLSAWCLIFVAVSPFTTISYIHTHGYDILGGKLCQRHRARIEEYLLVRSFRKKKKFCNCFSYFHFFIVLKF